MNQGDKVPRPSQPLLITPHIPSRLPNHSHLAHILITVCLTNNVNLPCLVSVPSQSNRVTAPDERILSNGDVLPKQQGKVDGHSHLDRWVVSVGRDVPSLLEGVDYDTVTSYCFQHSSNHPWAVSTILARLASVKAIRTQIMAKACQSSSTQAGGGLSWGGVYLIFVVIS